MGNAYIFTVQPTFTQGLILGQCSILLLLAVILKYLFLDSEPNKPLSYQPRILQTDDEVISEEIDAHEKDGLGETNRDALNAESMEWLNVTVKQILDAYRVKLRDNQPGVLGDEIARRRVEAFANERRPSGILDPIQVHSIDLGVSAPRLSNACHTKPSDTQSDHQIGFDISYSDTVSISFSTSVLFNYPFASFARLPVSLTVSLSLFSAPALLVPPQAHAEHPTLTVTLPAPQTDFVLELKTTSLLGSRAKLADVPKLHELINQQIRKVIQEKGIWKIVLPGLASVKEVKEDIAKEQKALL